MKNNRIQIIPTPRIRPSNFLRRTCPDRQSVSIITKTRYSISLARPAGPYLARSKKAINERGGSEWRALPAIPSDPTDIGSDIANATHIDGDPAETLRDTDEISARRSGFAIRLRDFEAYERNLNPESWQAHRSAFIETVCQQILVMPHFFDLAPYVPRLVKLAVACGDYEATMKLIVAVRDVHRVAVETCRLSVVGGFD